MKNFIGRQPILTTTRDVFGYEILFRSGTENSAVGGIGDISSDVLDTFLFFGFDRITSGRLAFVNCSREFLVRDYLTLLPKDRVVGEILETLTPDQETLDACRRLKDAGYRLALDDYVDSPVSAPFIEFADFVKVDFLITPPEERYRLAQEFSRRGIQLLAEKVETQYDVENATAMGYKYFQGFFFHRPEIAERGAVPPMKVQCLRILQAANQPELSIDRLADAIKQEPAVVYRLLCYLNSPIFALTANVSSVPHGLRLMGEKRTRKWLSLVCMATMAKDKPSELILSALTRARFCELLSEISTLRQSANEVFLLGLLSLMDAILDKPLSEVLREIHVQAEIQQALLNDSGPFRDLYNMVLCYEKGELTKLSQHAESLCADPNLFPELYVKSLDWANQIMAVA